MSQPAVSELGSLPFELVYSDGEPLASGWHVLQMYLLLEAERRRAEEAEAEVARLRALLENRGHG